MNVCFENLVTSRISVLWDQIKTTDNSPAKYRSTDLKVPGTFKKRALALLHKMPEV